MRWMNAAYGLVDLVKKNWQHTGVKTRSERALVAVTVRHVDDFLCSLDEEETRSDARKIISAGGCGNPTISCHVAGVRTEHQKDWGFLLFQSEFVDELREFRCRAIEENRRTACHNKSSQSWEDHWQVSAGNANKPDTNTAQQRAFNVLGSSKQLFRTTTLSSKAGRRNSQATRIFCVPRKRAKL